jgi:hypothetical protein
MKVPSRSETLLASGSQIPWCSSLMAERFMNKRTLVSERAFIIFCVALGAVQFWIIRFLLDTDGVSYLDVGDAFFRHDWARAVSAYWSPIYPWLLGLAINLIKPSIWWEATTAHAVNFLTYLFALFSFRFFLHCFYDSLEGEENADHSLPLPEWAFFGLGYCIFLWTSLELIDRYLNPDLLVEAFLFLLGGYLVQLRSSESYAKFAVFGVCCGAGYLSKAVMFPLGFALLAILLFSARISTRRLLGVGLACSMFLLVSGPFIAALSKQKRRLTFGDSGKLNYAFRVSPGVPAFHWQGEIPDGGTPKHPTRQLLDDPKVYEFSQPIGGTFPPWFDPSYWAEGARPKFRLRAQVLVLIQSARRYTTILTGQSGLLAGILAFIFWGGRATRRAILANWPLIAAGLLPIALYAIVLVLPRYVAGGFALLFVATLAGIRLPDIQNSGVFTRCLTAAVMATILFSVAAYLAETAYMANTVYSYPTPKDYMRAAEDLHAMGLQAGDAVAVIGTGEVNYWARLGRFKIIAEAFSPEPANARFWGSPPERRALAYQCFRRSGAKAVVAWSPPSGKEAGWAEIGTTNYYVYFLR